MLTLGTFWSLYELLQCCKTRSIAAAASPLVGMQNRRHHLCKRAGRFSPLRTRHRKLTIWPNIKPPSRRRWRTTLRRQACIGVGVVVVEGTCRMVEGAGNCVCERCLGMGVVFEGSTSPIHVQQGMCRCRITSHSCSHATRMWMRVVTMLAIVWQSTQVYGCHHHLSFASRVRWGCSNITTTTHSRVVFDKWAGHHHLSLAYRVRRVYANHH